MQAFETGTVAWFDPNKGFGKIRVRGGSTVFFKEHLRICQKDDRQPQKGDEVIFSSEPPRGLKNPETSWWSFADEFDATQVPADSAKENARRVAELMRRQLAQFGCTEAPVTASCLVSSKYGNERSRWVRSKVTTVIVLMTTPEDAFDLAPHEYIEKVGKIYEGNGVVGFFHNGRFHYYGARCLKSFLAVTLALDPETVSPPDDAVETLRKKAHKLLDRLTRDSSPEAQRACFENRFHPQMETMLRHYQDAKFSYRDRITMSNYDDITEVMKSLWLVATREVFGVAFDFWRELPIKFEVS